ncbi:MAG: L-threonylcarbamoyladenylate synthase, partial [Bacteroidota bacterium]|nr:L-threonylcarbamoyladenylate synthase [Bacteroidota bacterium]
MAHFYKIHPETPADREIFKAVEDFRNNAIGIYPTDSVYGLGCRLTNKAGVEKIARLKGIKPKKQEFSFIFSDIAQIEKYSLPLEKWAFRLLKKNLPGPFTFILKASKKIPKILEASRKTIGIRIPDNNIIREIVRN